MTDFRDYLSDDAAVQDELKKIEERGFIISYRTDRLVIRTPGGTILSVCFNKMQIYAFVKKNITAGDGAKASTNQPDHHAAAKWDRAAFRREIFSPKRMLVFAILQMVPSSYSGQLTASLERVVNVTDGRVRMVRIDMAEESILTDQLKADGFQMAPDTTLLAVLDGNVIGVLLGVVPDHESRRFIERALETLHFSGQEPSRPEDHKFNEGLHSASDASPEARIVELEKTISRLRERGRLAVAQRDQWEKRALAAEQQLANREEGNANRKYQQLKNALAKDFHPDHSSASGIEKIIRTEIFKLIWAKIEEIDRS